MKTIKLLALLVVLAVAGLANAQTLTRSLVLKPAGETNTLTFGSSAPIGTSYSIDLPGGGNAAGGPIVKTTTAAGTKTWSFGQINLAANTAISGDVTGTLGVTNGGTGLNNAPINSILYASAANVYSSLSTGAAGQVLGSVAGVPTWGTTLGGGGATTNISSTGAGNTTNINAAPATAGTTNIGNNTSTTNLNGTVVFQNAPSIPLAENNIWVGNASNLQAAVPPTANSILITAGTGGLVPQWGTTLPTGLTLPGATITTPTLTGGTINNTVIGGVTPAAGTFTALTSVGATNLNATGTGTTNIGNNAGPAVTNIAGDVNFTASTPVNFSVMPELPLAENSLYVGNASNYAQAYATTAERILTSPGGVPTWSSTLPSGVTVGFDQISTGTNVTATMTVGTGGSLVPGGTGIITATRFTGTGSTTNAVDLATAEVNGVLPIANGGTNSSTVGGAGTVTYSNGTALVSTAAGTTGQILQSNGAGAPSWTNVGNLLASASFSLTADATAETNGYFTVNTTSVPTLVTGYGYDASARVIVTLESASGPGQVVTVTNRTANSFRVYTGATTAGDIINVVIIDTTP
jgi:hypothetical protein